MTVNMTGEIILWSVLVVANLIVFIIWRNK